MKFAGKGDRGGRPYQARLLFVITARGVMPTPTRPASGGAPAPTRQLRDPRDDSILVKLDYLPDVLVVDKQLGQVLDSLKKHVGRPAVWLDKLDRANNAVLAVILDDLSVDTITVPIVEAAAHRARHPTPNPGSAAERAVSASDNILVEANVVHADAAARQRKQTGTPKSARRMEKEAAVERRESILANLADAHWSKNAQTHALARMRSWAADVRAASIAKQQLAEKKRAEQARREQAAKLEREAATKLKRKLARERAARSKSQLSEMAAKHAARAALRKCAATAKTWAAAGGPPPSPSDDSSDSESDDDEPQSSSSSSSDDEKSELEIALTEIGLGRCASVVSSHRIETVAAFAKLSAGERKSMMGKLSSAEKSAVKKLLEQQKAKPPPPAKQRGTASKAKTSTPRQTTAPVAAPPAKTNSPFVGCALVELALGHLPRDVQSAAAFAWVSSIGSAVAAVNKNADTLLKAVAAEQEAPEALEVVLEIAVADGLLDRDSLKVDVEAFADGPSALRLAKLHANRLAIAMSPSRPSIAAPEQPSSSAPANDWSENKDSVLQMMAEQMQGGASKSGEIKSVTTLNRLKAVAADTSAFSALKELAEAARENKMTVDSFKSTVATHPKILNAVYSDLKVKTPNGTLAHRTHELAVTVQGRLLERVGQEGGSFLPVGARSFAKSIAEACINGTLGSTFDWTKLYIPKAADAKKKDSSIAKDDKSAMAIAAALPGIEFILEELFSDDKTIPQLFKKLRGVMTAADSAGCSTKDMIEGLLSPLLKRFSEDWEFFHSGSERSKLGKIWERIVSADGGDPIVRSFIDAYGPGAKAGGSSAKEIADLKKLVDSLTEKVTATEQKNKNLNERCSRLEHVCKTRFKEMGVEVDFRHAPGDSEGSSGGRGSGGKGGGRGGGGKGGRGKGANASAPSPDKTEEVKAVKEE